MRFYEEKGEMKIFLGIIILVLITSVSYCQGVGNIEGIFYSKDSSYVMIDGKIYKPDDYVCGGKIINISLDEVKIKFQDREKIYTSGMSITGIKAEKPTRVPPTISTTKKKSKSYTQKSVKEINEIESVKLVMYEDFGVLTGYIIFIDKDGKQCALDYCEGAELESIAFNKTFPISQNDFKVLSLRFGNSKIFAYPLGDIVVEDLHEKYGGRDLWVKFKLRWLDDRVRVFIPED
jgi:hypothetical protein